MEVKEKLTFSNACIIAAKWLSDIQRESTTNTHGKHKQELRVRNIHVHVDTFEITMKLNS